MNLDFLKNKKILNWSMYDFANQPFTTLVVTFIFNAFFVDYLSQDLGVNPEEAEEKGTWLWSIGIAVTAVFVAFLSPVLGALADSAGYRKVFLIFFSYLCVVATCCLWFFHPDLFCNYENQAISFLGFDLNIAVCALIVFVIANIGFEFGTVFCNSYLTELATKKDVGRVSGFAWGLGFIGGLISLIIALYMVDTYSTFENNFAGVRLTNILVAVWFLVFSIPPFFLLKDSKPNKAISSHIKKSISSIRSSFHSIRKYKTITRFLIARLFYNDALITIFAFGGIYAETALDFTFPEVIKLGIALNISACAGSFLFGFLEDKIGIKKMLNITLWCLVFATVLAFLSPMITSHDNLITPKTLFWIAGVIIGFMQGPNQSGSRALMTRLTPDKKKNEFFGFYAFSGKATAFIGPILYGYSVDYFNTEQAGLVVVFILFFVGMILFSSLKIKDADIQL